jgi:hypothetical protein
VLWYLGFASKSDHPPRPLKANSYPAEENRASMRKARNLLALYAID